MTRRGATLLSAALAASCLDPIEPDVGPPLRPACRDEDSDPEADVSYRADIQDGLFTRIDLACVDCHSTGGLAIGLEVSGLDLSSYAALRLGGVQSGDEIALPGRPCASVLVQKLGAAPPFGTRMPIGGPPFLTRAEMQLVSDWIAEGADDD